MRKTILAICVGALCGCASGPQVISGNAAGVVVDHPASNPETSRMLAVANQYCANYGKIARFNAPVSEKQSSFDCVQP